MRNPIRVNLRCLRSSWSSPVSGSIYYIAPVCRRSPGSYVLLAISAGFVSECRHRSGKNHHTLVESRSSARCRRPGPSVFFGHETPFAAVIAAVAIVTHHEIMALGHYPLTIAAGSASCSRMSCFTSPRFPRRNGIGTGRLHFTSEPL